MTNDSRQQTGHPGFGFNNNAVSPSPLSDQPNLSRPPTSAPSVASSIGSAPKSGQIPSFNSKPVDSRNSSLAKPVGSRASSSSRPVGSRASSIAKPLYGPHVNVTTPKITPAGSQITSGLHTPLGVIEERTAFNSPELKSLLDRQTIRRADGVTLLCPACKKMSSSVPSNKMSDTGWMWVGCLCLCLPPLCIAPLFMEDCHEKKRLCVSCGEETLATNWMPPAPHSTATSPALTRSPSIHSIISNTSHTNKPMAKPNFVQVSPSARAVTPDGSFLPPRPVSSQSLLPPAPTSRSVSSTSSSPSRPVSRPVSPSLVPHQKPTVLSAPSSPAAPATPEPQPETKPDSETEPTKREMKPVSKPAGSLPPILPLRAGLQTPTLTSLFGSRTPLPSSSIVIPSQTAPAG